MKSQRFSRSLCALLVALMLSCDGKEEAKITPDPNPNASDLPFTKGGEKPPAPVVAEKYPAPTNFKYENGKITWSKPKGFEKEEFLYYIFFFEADDKVQNTQDMTGAKQIEDESYAYELPKGKTAMIVRVIASGTKKVSPASEPYTIKAPVVGTLPEEKKVLNPITNPVAKDKPVEVVAAAPVNTAKEEELNTREIIVTEGKAGKKDNTPVVTDASVSEKTSPSAGKLTPELAAIGPKPVGKLGDYNGGDGSKVPAYVPRPITKVRLFLPLEISAGGEAQRSLRVMSGANLTLTPDPKLPKEFKGNDSVSLELEGDKKINFGFESKTKMKVSLNQINQYIIEKDKSYGFTLNVLNGDTSEELFTEGTLFPLNYALVSLSSQEKILKINNTTESALITVKNFKSKDRMQLCTWKTRKADIVTEFDPQSTIFDLTKEHLTRIISDYTNEAKGKTQPYYMPTFMTCSKRITQMNKETGVQFITDVLVNIDPELLPKIQVVP